MSSRTLKSALLALLCAAPLLRAQEVSVSNPFSTDLEGAPPVLPQFRDQETPSYPDRMLDSSDIGCVLVHEYIDTDGKKLAGGIISSLRPFADVTERAKIDWTFKPAERAGQPVSSVIWVMVVFNPASAGRHRREATPRLLAAHPWIYPEERSVQKPAQFFAVASVDADGRVTQATVEGAADAGTQAGILAELKTWRFAPAREHGQPVAAQVRVPVFGVPAIALVDDGVLTRPPRAVHQVDPEYPASMRQLGIRARVVLSCIIDTEGRVRRTEVVQSDNPAFDQPAVDALLKWRFEPGLEDGVPVNTGMTETILFHLIGQPDGGRDAYTILPGDNDRLPAVFRYDVAPRLIGAVLPVYPYALYREGMHGKAEVAFAVGPNGFVVDAKVVKADRPEFGQAVCAMLDEYRFEPALKAGKPCAALMRVVEDFSFNSNDLALSYEDRRIARLLKENSPKLFRLQNLDALPRALSERPPVYPRVLAHKTSDGKALVSFVIDRTGAVRWPHAVSATEDAFGYAAVQAIAQWKFTPPLMHGKPVDALAEIPIVFKAPGPSSTDEKPAQK